MKARERWTIGLCVIAGELIGAAIGGASVWPDFSQRVRLAWNGGSGESADWGEPLFYMIAMGIPPGLLGGLIAFVIVLAIRRWQRSKLAKTGVRDA